MMFRILNMRVARAVLAGSGIVIMTLVTAGCRHGVFDERVRADYYTGSLYKYPHSKHPIKVSRGALEMSIPVGSRDSGLNSFKQNELRTFLHYYRDQGAGRLHISMPRYSRHQHALNNVLVDVTYELKQMSLSPEDVKMNKYKGHSRTPSVISLSFERHVANGPDCGEFNQNLAVDENNDSSDYWGCASQNNLAAMVANPRDLKGPRGWSPRDARRRDVIMDKHIKGESTHAKRSEWERVDASGISK